jgi:hypothetical protein
MCSRSQPVVIVQALRVDERRAAAPVLGNEFLAPLGPHFVAQFGEFRSRLTQGDNVFGCNAHRFLLASVVADGLNSVQNYVKS